MVAQGGGAIVNTASIAGLIGLPTSSAYVAAKHGVVGLTKTAALEYADDKIRVNAVCPGYIETKMTEDTMRRRGEELMAKVPFRRMGKPEEIAEMVVWLCSDRASYVSGAASTWMAGIWRPDRRRRRLDTGALVESLLPGPIGRCDLAVRLRDDRPFRRIWG